MDDQDLDLLQEFVIETMEQLERVEPDLLTLEIGIRPESDVINRLFRAVHSVKGAAGFFDLNTIGRLAHAMENLLSNFRDGTILPSEAMVDGLLQSNDRLVGMMQAIEKSNDEVIDGEVKLLLNFVTVAKASASAPAPESAYSGPVDEDDGLPLPDVDEVRAQMAAEAAAAASRAAQPVDEDDGLPLPDVDEIRAQMAAEAKAKEAAEQAKADAKQAKADAEQAKASSKTDAVAAPPEKRRRKVDETVRVKTSVLNALMEMAGEIVLGRNRLVRMLQPHLEQLEGVGPILQQVSAITTDIQEQVMRTRVQPIGMLFGRFRRVVRDMSLKLEKEVQLVTEGEDVELDRTIIEALPDPLTHLLRNSLDHGIGMPAERVAAGKSRLGTIKISAYHEDGMINIDIEDDGRGINPAVIRSKAISKGIATEEELDRASEREILNLIFYPGFSTAEKVSAVSGRGVGMDVVRTNVEKLGGTVELQSVLGRGTTISLQLPLTLAIVSSLIIEVEQLRFALPQVGLVEVVRLKAGQQNERLEEVSGAEVLRHRGSLLPIVRLSAVLGLKTTYVTEDGASAPDRRHRLNDRRSPDDVGPEVSRRAGGPDRRKGRQLIQRILVIRMGNSRFGLLVDQILATEEIVVKPLSRFLRGCPCFSGNTILGDGAIAMILDAKGIVAEAKLKFSDLTVSTDQTDIRRKSLGEKVPMLLFENGAKEMFALPVSQVARIEKLEPDSIETVGDKRYARYRGEPLPLVYLHDHLSVQAPASNDDHLFMLIPKDSRHAVGIATPKVLDTVQVEIGVDERSIKGPGLVGSVILDKRLVILLEMHGVLDLAAPEEAFKPQPLARAPRVLLAEHTPYYAALVAGYLQMIDATVVRVTDAAAMSEQLDGGQFDICLVDLNLPGYDAAALLGATMRDDGRLPVVGLVLPPVEEDPSDDSGNPCTIYRSKLDRDQLLESIVTLLGGVG